MPTDISQDLSKKKNWLAILGIALDIQNTFSTRQTPYKTEILAKKKFVDFIRIKILV